MAASRKNSYISCLTFLATVAVVLWHINDGVYSVANSMSWYLTVVIDAAVHFSVPVFFMITGANLIDFRERGDSLRVYARKRIRKTLIPFLFWSIIFIIYYGRQDLEVFIDDGRYLQMILYFLRCILDFRYYTAFWFFINLFGIYLLIPLLSLIPPDKRKTAFSVIVAFLFVTHYILPFILYFSGFDAVSKSGSFFILFVLCGYLIKTYDIPKLLRTVIYVLGIAGFIAFILGTVRMSLAAGEFIELFRIKDGLITCLITIAVFTFAKYNLNFNAGGKFMAFVNRFNKYSLSIYILHIFVLKEILPLMGIDMFSANINHAVFYPVSLVLIIVICIAFSWIIKKIPLLKNTLP